MNNLLDHNYDGIQEYDNPLPNWWLMIFCGTVIFGFIYLIHYTVGGGDTQDQELALDMQNIPKSNVKIWQDSELADKIDGPDFLIKGQAAFVSKCSVCHGPEGQGVIGPNLADNFWIHGQGKRSDIINVVSQGVAEKGMPAWSEVLSEDELLAVTAYIYSLKNTNPVNPKASQGKEYEN